MWGKGGGDYQWALYKTISRFTFSIIESKLMQDKFLIRLFSNVAFYC